MAFAWDEIQERWLARRFGGRCERFQGKVAVAGGSLEIDALAEGARGDPLFDFLTKLTLFENKAPDETFQGSDLLLVAARTLLLLHRRRLQPPALADVTQVVLCSRAAAKLHRQLGLHQVRPGVYEGHFVARLILVQANDVTVQHETLAFLVHYASGRALRKAVEAAVDAQRTELYPVLWLLRGKVFKEVLAMKGKTVDPLMLEVREAVEEIGIAHVVEQVGIKRVVEEVGIEQVVEALGVEQVVEALGVEQVVEALGVEQVVEAVGVERVLKAVGIERVLKAVGVEQVIKSVGPERFAQSLGVEQLRKVLDRLDQKTKRGKPPRNGKSRRRPKASKPSS
jgi:hypothetical protein